MTYKHDPACRVNKFGENSDLTWRDQVHTYGRNPWREQRLLHPDTIFQSRLRGVTP